MADECFKCGASGDKVKLYDAVSDRGIVKICDNCFSEEKLPIIKKQTETQITESQRYRTIQERMAVMNKARTRKQEVSLKDLIEKKFKMKGALHPDLIENFHWKIQRLKRERKITRGQFARAIGESEATVKMIEQGFLPKDNYKIIGKIENYFGVSLKKPGVSGFPTDKLSADTSASDEKKKLSFDEDMVNRLKISDLREMNKRFSEKKRRFLFFGGKEDPEEPIDSWEEE